MKRTCYRDGSAGRAPSFETQCCLRKVARGWERNNTSVTLEGFGVQEGFAALEGIGITKKSGSPSNLQTLKTLKTPLKTGAARALPGASNSASELGPVPCHGRMSESRLSGPRPGVRPLPTVAQVSAVSRRFKSRHLETDRTDRLHCLERSSGRHYYNGFLHHRDHHHHHHRSPANRKQRHYDTSLYKHGRPRRGPRPGAQSPALEPSGH